MSKKYNIRIYLGTNKIYAFLRTKTEGLMPDDKVDVTKDAIYAVVAHLVRNNMTGVSFNKEKLFLLATDNREDFKNMLKIHRKYLDSQECK